MPHAKTYKKYQLGRSSIIFYLYDLSTVFCPTTRRNIPWLYALFLDGSRSRPAVRVASPAPEARRRCIGRLCTAVPPWSSSWSLRGPRWTRPTTTAVASEGFFGSFWEWLWRGDGRGSYIGSWFSCYALGCWVVLTKTTKWRYFHFRHLMKILVVIWTYYRSVFLYFYLFSLIFQCFFDDQNWL